MMHCRSQQAIERPHSRHMQRLTLLAQAGEQDAVPATAQGGVLLICTRVTSVDPQLQEMGEAFLASMAMKWRPAINDLLMEIIAACVLVRIL